ncbi:MAG TPA: hypothetical protein PKE27_19105 [Povalibacter sp.]|uniref:hypothetical protein n=1 Tax=Povalibacter sp. TaxID=1962978 RepID=UPI002BF43BA9|nr:hypothetical protein [Povalibacter sp.]HMN46693.1 hypothetical protein [Povalibacter sp.]
MIFFHDLDPDEIAGILRRYGLNLVQVAPGETIAGSYWGESEAGLIVDRLYVRPDTPLHSLLHEASHFICMDEARRAGLDRDAGGDYAEENAVCYLQIVLADHLSGGSRGQMQADMDAWGYTFRLGSARAWFEQDADDARDWLVTQGVIDRDGRPTWRVRS